MSMKKQEEWIVHPLEPVFDSRSEVLVLGTMPSPKSRELGFYYGHPQNRFWRVMAALFGERFPESNGERRDLMLRHHIALWDVLASCTIAGASDASIRDAVPNDLERIVQESQVKAIFCTGTKSYALFRRFFGDSLGVPCYKLPSTSPANAAADIDELTGAYRAILDFVNPPSPVTLNVPDVVALEQAIAADGTSLAELMDRAGTWLAWRVHELRPTAHVTVFCGSGNNGGDGWVAARLLATWGHAVRVVSAKLPDELRAQPARDAAIAAFGLFGKLSVELLTCENEREAFSLFDGASDDVAIDAILGTGFSGDAVKAPYDGWIRAMNAAREQGACIVVAADVPSGYSAQTGSASDPCVCADETVTMICRKTGLDLPHAPGYCGNVFVAPLAYIEPYL